MSETNMNSKGGQVRCGFHDSANCRQKFTAATGRPTPDSGTTLRAKDSGGRSGCARHLMAQ
jgi:hypothetical protein